MAKVWSDLAPGEMAEIERAYKAGKEPAEIAGRYGLKPKQISDQAYRKNWPKPSSRFSNPTPKPRASGKTGKQTAKQTAKKTGKKAAKKKARR